MTEVVLIPWYWWLIAAALLMTAEIFVAGFVLAGFGFAAVIAGLAQWITTDTGWAIAAFCAASLVFFFAIRPLALRTFMNAEPSPFGVQAMLGQEVTVVDSPDVGGGLQAVFRDTRWSVRSDDTLTEGDKARIIAVDATTLVVERIT